jgi:hypothetical protein
MRFYFHLHNGVVTRDEEGIELPSDEAARSHALAEARVMAAESVREGYLDVAHSIKVTKHDGEEMFEIFFGDVVEIRGRPGIAEYN